MKEQTSLAEIEAKAKKVKITGSEALMLSLVKENVDNFFFFKVNTCLDPRHHDTTVGDVEKESL